MLVINPDECIDCGVCEPECPAEAILPDTEPGMEKYLELNRKYSEIWPNITIKKDPPSDSDKYKDVENKLEFFSEEPGEGD
jgi:ferredoxin